MFDRSLHDEFCPIHSKFQAFRLASQDIKRLRDQETGAGIKLRPWLLVFAGQAAFPAKANRSDFKLTYNLATSAMSGVDFTSSGVVMSQTQTSSVIRSLENVRERVKQRLAKVAEYRAFLAIETPMAEVAHIPDLHAHLESAKQKILERLTLTREYQGLLTVEKAIKEIAEVLEVVGDDASDGVVAASPSRIGLAALVHESFVAQSGDNEALPADQGGEPDKARVA